MKIKFISDVVWHYSKENLEKEYRINLEHPSWYLFEFMLLTFEDYFLQLEISGNRKFDINDWGDLLNLVYVQPNKLYWTFEKKWNNVFRNNEVLSRYIYNKNTI